MNTTKQSDRPTVTSHIDKLHDERDRAQRALDVADEDFDGAPKQSTAAHEALQRINAARARVETLDREIELERERASRQHTPAELTFGEQVLAINATNPRLQQLKYERAIELAHIEAAKRGEEVPFARVDELSDLQRDEIFFVSEILGTHISGDAGCWRRIPLHQIHREICRAADVRHTVDSHLNCEPLDPYYVGQLAHGCRDGGQARKMAEYKTGRTFASEAAAVRARRTNDFRHVSAQQPTIAVRS
jgi:hypothetical protein